MYVDAPTYNAVLPLFMSLACLLTLKLMTALSRRLVCIMGFCRQVHKKRNARAGIELLSMEKKLEFWEKVKPAQSLDPRVSPEFGSDRFSY